MKSLNEKVAQIKSEVAEIASKTFTGKSIQERINEKILKNFSKNS